MPGKSRFAGSRGTFVADAEGARADEGLLARAVRAAVDAVAAADAEDDPWGPPVPGMPPPF